MYYVDLFLADYIDAFIQWGFLMAMLYALVSSINTLNKSLVYLATIMFFSYLIGDFLLVFKNVYLNWIFFDFATVCIIFIITKASSFESDVAKNYIVSGLLINACLTYAIYIDLYINWNSDPWWLWSLYSMGVNVVDLLMIITIFINKDFLGLMKLKGRLFRSRAEFKSP
ncbi:hypothetical protein [Pseudoalteromonas sp. SM9913]|uniref:Membrane protein triplicated sequence n=1 Tax=Pseudoalteromonas tetraodonis GFC TaxID=1315271 RepID=A0AA37W5B5_9GAMM|nr:hypothetical protein [Pseudoalteromonas sp. SM9913]ATD02413.1 hypothetical protein PTET_a0902 [Pseudoalteromonas tetraodonis]PHQ94928.1 MAG: hypothetical protein COB48_03875 [Pseudoalteromonas sp.]GEN38368.1 hypothetical protein PTE01_14780 [Pseudoalteromonas tetraodonis GFC]ADT67750.1 conserved hypothetical protein [Pseudoalteromonas sp. SM9913]GLQ03393.1 hypothetical protein GCM10007914_22740 [Pseudoalteromonas tetraodonis GFC]|tara:strand:- start:737 stop:1246 length:510 start_codon:yes stop_codon:yes gene_type:complete